MTTSQQPWSIEVNSITGGANLKDSHGKLIAMFKSYNDAEFVISLLKEKNELPKFIENVITLLENDMVEESINKLEDLT
jgi:hypothetical protein